MKILFLTNNIITDKLYTWLINTEDTVIKINDRVTIEIIKDINPNLIISYNYKYIINKEVIDYMGKGNVINLHISYLPFNKGSLPNFWSFVDDSPKGVCIHLIDEELDTGDVLLRKKITFNEIIETFETTYIKLHNEIQDLFIKHWDEIKNGSIVATKQEHEGTLHTLKEFKKLEEKIGPISWSENIKEFKDRIKGLI